MTVGSLFSGIGGLDLGLERAGFEIRWQVERDPYCQRVLARHWPDVPCYDDITQIRGADLEPVDLLCGGFPCPPVSVAGKGLGDADDRWLWPEFARLIREVGPRYVLVENVTGLLAHPREFGSVLGELAESGYDAEWDCIPAAAVGAPHRRDRLWIVAHSDSGRALGVRRQGDYRNQEWDTEASIQERKDVESRPESASCSPEILAHTDSRGCQVERIGRIFHGQRMPFWDDADRRNRAWWDVDPADLPDTDSAGREAIQPEPKQLQEEQSSADARRREGSFKSHVGRVASRVPRRVDRLRGLGNAVVPAVAEFIGRRILEVELCSRYRSTGT